MNYKEKTSELNTAFTDQLMRCHSASNFLLLKNLSVALARALLASALLFLLSLDLFIGDVSFLS